MKSLAVLIFPGIQTLDLFGPIEMLGGVFDKIAITLVAEADEPLATRHGQRIVPDKTIADGSDYDLLLIPGGDSALEVAKNSTDGQVVSTRACLTGQTVAPYCTIMLKWSEGAPAPDGICGAEIKEVVLL